MRSSADDPLRDVLVTAAADIVASVTGAEPGRATVVIDGRSGAGKSTLADLVVAAWDRPGRVRLLRLDDVYPGWGGLSAATRTVTHDVLIARAAGVAGSWRAWDWDADRPAERRTIGAFGDLIVEGCGSLTPATAALADVSVWVDGDADARRHRALLRDGDGFRPHWEEWAAQEADHIDEHRPAERADLVVTVP